MRTVIHLRNEQEEALPEELTRDESNDVRYPPSLVRHFLAAHTRAGDLVFDPFAGFGTTMLTAEAMGRLSRGIEYDPRRCAYVRSRLRDPAALVHGDARQLASYGLPRIDFSITSPPYMSRNDPTDPFSGYSTPGRGYAGYLADVREIYRQLAALMNDSALAVVEIANLKGAAGVTTLAWDVGRAIGEVLRFEGELIVEWQPSYGYGYDHSYCLTFRK